MILIFWFTYLLLLLYVFLKGKNIGFKRTFIWMSFRNLCKWLVIFTYFDLICLFCFYFLWFTLLFLFEVIVCTSWASTNFFDIIRSSLVFLMFSFIIFGLVRIVFPAFLWTFLLLYNSNLSILVLCCNRLGKGRLCFTLALLIFSNFYCFFVIFIKLFFCLVVIFKVIIHRLSRFFWTNTISISMLWVQCPIVWIQALRHFFWSSVIIVVFFLYCLWLKLLNFLFLK